MNIEEIKKVFTDHVKKYNINDKAILLKYEHSYRVMNFCEQIAKDIGLNEEDTNLAIAIGLLHDYARFEQWKRYRVYSDVRSVDHADLAVELLFYEGEIEKFGISEKYYQIIYDAIKYHNKFSFPENLNSRNKLFCEIIRDADKFDILYLFGLPGKTTKDDGNDVSEDVKIDFYNNKPIKMNLKNNKSDIVLLRLAFIFDLNFEYSYRYLRDNKLLDKYFDNIENKSKILIYFNYINSYIDNYLEERSKNHAGKKI